MCVLAPVAVFCKVRVSPCLLDKVGAQVQEIEREDPCEGLSVRLACSLHSLNATFSSFSTSTSISSFILLFTQ